MKMRMFQDDVEKHRKHQRSQLFMKAELEHEGRTLDVRLRNLSADGALLQGDNLPPEGAQVVFRRTELSVAARVAWSSKDRAGIQFAEQLSPDTVLRHIPEPRQRMQPDVKRPGFRPVEMKPHEREFVNRVVFGRPRDF